MHEAYFMSAPAKIPVQIESIASFDNYVLIGTRQGHLIMYQINMSPNTGGAAFAAVVDVAAGGIPTPTTPGPQIDLDLKHYNKGFSDKPIRQIEVIVEHQLLFALASDTVCVYDMHDHKRDFPLVNRVAGTRGASIFTLDVKRSQSLTGEAVLMVRMAVAVKRKLQLWYWKHNEFLRLPMPDIDLADVPRALRWSENTIVVGLKGDYLYYDLSGNTPVKNELFPTGSRVHDPCIVQINDYFAVAKDEVLIAVQPKSTSTSSSSTGSNCVQTHQHQQQLPIGGSSGSAFASSQQLAADAVADTFRSFVWSHPIQVFVWDEPYVIALTSRALEVRVKASDGADKDTHIQTLADVPNARFLLRLRQGALIVASSSTFWYVQAVDIARQRQHLLQQKRFHLALQLTEISAESADEKLERQNHIQTAYAFDLFARKAFKESMAEFIKLKTDPCDVIRLFPDLLPASAASGGGGGVGASPSKAPEAALVAALDDRDLENGLVALSGFLTDARYHVREELSIQEKLRASGGTSAGESKRFGKNLPQLQSIIDTTLLKCYLQTNDSLVPSLIRSRFCHFEESEKVLKQYRKLDELKLLYEQNGYHRKALQLLEAEAVKPNSRLAGHDQTVQYLLQLRPEHARLIFEFAGWVLRKHPDDGLAIFTDDLVREDHLQRAAVLDYLLREHKLLVVRYLEHIIHVWHETKAMFHEILIQQYLQNVNDIRAEIELAGGVEKAPQEFHASLQSARKTLLQFLRTSPHYRGEQILKALPPNQLFEERAVVLGKLQFHDKCIAIYIQILGDAEAAADYCAAVYEADPSNDTIYVSLVEKLLHVPTVPPYSDVPLHERCLQPNVDFVLALLERHATRFNALAVLQTLPDTVSLHRVRAFIERAMQHHQQQQTDAQVLRGILNAEKVQLQDELAALRSQSFVLTELSVCPECGKRFSNQSAFVRQPSGRIVHYSCQRAD